MKKIFLTALMAAAIISPAAVSQAAVDEGVLVSYYTDYDSRDFRGKADWFVVVNCSEWVSLRSAPTVHADALARIPLGTRVLVSDVDPRNGFLPVQYGGMNGYVLAQYLRFVSMS